MRMDRVMLRTIIVQLLLHDGIGSATVAHLFKNNPDSLTHELYSLSVEAIAEKYSIPGRYASLVHAALRALEPLARHDAWCAAHGVRVVTLFDPEYPVRLKHIGAPPVALWVRGVLPGSGMPSCALVGSRNATPYGKRVSKMIVPALVAGGVATVSGGARGIDGWVHQETIAAGGHTTVVMGCGLAHTYPVEHHTLFEDVVASGGALVSPFPPHMEPSKGTFPARNRIIAGLADACIVVQAAAQSGALITAAHALEENREVAAVPGAIDDVLSVGTNQLIAQGARVIYDAASALELCGRGTTAVSASCGVIVSTDAQAILRVLETPLMLDELVAVSQKPRAVVQSALFELELAGKCMQNHAGMWERCG
jgi:DNA processing protein